MTRINVLPPEELCNQHLLAEYRELPRVFKLAREVADAPEQYTMGAGHVKFFYNKLMFLYLRQRLLWEELNRRGYKTTYRPESLLVYAKLKPTLWGTYEPDYKALQTNKIRIEQRLLEMKNPSFNTMAGKERAA